MNLSGSLNAFRLLVRPGLCIPHLQISTFDQLPIPLAHPAFPTIKAVVLDKDNCFAVKRTTEIYPAYVNRFNALKEAYPDNRLLIVSNRAGTAHHQQEAELLEKTTGVKVLRHSTKKPGCGRDILAHFKACANVAISDPAEIAVIGDRIFTDIMLANMLGSLGIWIRDGVVAQCGVVGATLSPLVRQLTDRKLDGLEKGLPHVLETVGIRAPTPA